MIFVDGKEVPEFLSEALVPSRTAHVEIDLQNDYCHPNGAFAQAGADVSAYPSVIETVSGLISETRKLGVLQVFVKMISLPNGLSDSPAWIWLSRKLSVQYMGELANIQNPVRPCIKGTWGAELVEKLVVSDDDLVIEKFRSSAFYETSLDMLLRSNNIQTLIFTGCTTEGCVESTVRDASFRGYFSIVVRDGVASDIASLHEASLTVMSAYRADVVDATNVLNALRT